MLVANQSTENIGQTPDLLHRQGFELLYSYNGLHHTRTDTEDHLRLRAALFR